MQKIHPCLWFDDRAEEAAKFYVSVFNNSKVGQITRYGKNMPMPEGEVLTVSFTLDGQSFTALNGGPQFRFTEAVSMVVNCESQAEIDAMWAKLVEGGQESQCGWLKDRFGLSWQIVPVRLFQMLGDPDAQKSQRVLDALSAMVKLDLAALEKAYVSA